MLNYATLYSFLFRVIEVFKKYFSTNFLVENKFKQTILHMVLKAGYYNKIAVHGDESGEVGEKNFFWLYILFF